MKNGTRVRTKFGMATVMGKEFYCGARYRVVTKLDDPEKWACSKISEKCCFLPSEVEEINE